MSNGTADNRATADGEAERALVRYADILDGRKRLFEGRVGLLGFEDFQFYRNRCGHLPPEIESAFACACDELRKAGHDPAAAAIANLHAQLAEKFEKTAESFREALRLFQEWEDAHKLEDPFTPAILKEPPPEEPAPWDEAGSAQWKQTKQQRHEAWKQLRDKLGGVIPSECAFRDCELHLSHAYQPLLKSLEECFEQNAAVVHGIIKSGVRDIHGEKLEQILAAVCLGNRAQAKTKQEVVKLRDEVQGLKPEVEAAKTAAEGAEKIGAKTHGLLSSFLAAAPEWLKRAVSRISFGKDPLYRAKRKAVCDKWLEFKSGECDTECPDGTLRTAGGKRDYQEFREAYRDVVVFNGKTLGTLYPDGKDLKELAKDIEGERKRRKRAEGKKPA